MNRPAPMVVPGENRVIYKYPFHLGDFTLQMPQDAEILHLDCQRGPLSPTLWVLVDPSLPYADRRFHIYGTGHPIFADPGTFLTYIGTWQMDGYVWHLWEQRIMEGG